MRNLINDNYIIFAHKNDYKNETLKEHIGKTKIYLDKIIIDKGLQKILSDIINKIDSKNSNIIREMFENAIIYHDIGKVNPAFQQIKMQNTLPFYTNKPEYNNDEHSLLSAYIYLSYYLKKIKDNYDKSDRKVLNYICYVFAYIISRHHSSLNNEFFDVDGNGDSFVNKLEDLQNLIEQTNGYYIKPINNLPEYKKPLNLKAFGNNQIEFYILCKLLYSLLISSDYYATYSFIYGKEIDDLGLFNDNLKTTFINTFEQNKIVKNIRTNNNSLPINILRSEIFMEAEKNLLKDIDKKMFYLESPTGSGKTINSINLALKLLQTENINKVFYVFPFNTLSEQTVSSLSDIFKELGDSIAMINSITPIKELDNQGYVENYIDRLFINYPMNILSHVGLFNILFGTNKEFNFPFYSLCNSVIILDEIQAYNVGIWKEIINMLQKFADTLNIKVIIMSATLPKLDLLLKEDYKIVDLIKNPKYYFNNYIFKNRVEVDFSLLDKPKNLIDIVAFLDNNVDSYNKILVEFQDKKHCRDFYNTIINRYPDYEIYEITGDDNNVFRKQVINRVKQDNVKVIIVSTQVIEAGVDIDMDLGIKEISILESEEQFLGRINRSCKKQGCKAYFFTLTDTKTKFIYKDDIRKRYNLKNKRLQEILRTKEFKNYYTQCLKDINEEKNKININNYEEFISKIENLMFLDINEHMKLISTDTLTIYLPHNKIKGLNGYDLWQEFIELLDNKTISFSEKKIKLSKLYSRMSCFTFNIFNNKKLKLDREDEIERATNSCLFNDIEYKNGIYYIRNGEQYITEEGKLDREGLKEYLSYFEGLFL